MVSLSIVNHVKALKLKMAVIQYNFPGVTIDGMSKLTSSLESVCESLDEGNYPRAFKLIADSKIALSHLTPNNPIIDWGFNQDLKTLESLITFPQSKAA